MLGQEKDGLGGSFDQNQRFVGLLNGVNVWNRVFLLIRSGPTKSVAPMGGAMCTGGQISEML